MSKIVPFCGVRPSKDKAHLVTSQSVDRYSKAEINAKMASNPYSFLHIIKPKLSQPESKIKPGSREFLLQIKDQYKKYLSEGWLIDDDRACYYLYEQKNATYSSTGIIAAIHIDEYINGNVKIHEHTLTERENKLKEYLEICDFNAEPVCMFFESDKDWDFYLEQLKVQTPEYFFTTTDQITHSLWVLSDENIVSYLHEKFNALQNVYIADGHHRSAASALLAKYQRELKFKYTGNEGFNFLLGIFFPENQLKIFSYNRLIKDVFEISDNKILDLISENFSIEEINNINIELQEQTEILMLTESKSYLLKLKKKSPHHSEFNIGSSLLSDLILEPVFNIVDLKKDKRVEFVPGKLNNENLKTSIQSGKYKCAFVLCKVSMDLLKKIADHHMIMPPKSTWIEPKLRSGLVIYDIAKHGY